jgi:two-component system OmpR family sensor kinase
MRTLFLRIFISFWMAMALILISAIGVTATVAWYRFSKLSSIEPGQLIGEAAKTLHDGDVSGLKTWLAKITSEHPDLDIYVVDTAGEDIMQRPLPPRITQWLVLGGRPAIKDIRNHYNWPYGYDLAPGGITTHSLALNRSHLLANPTLIAPDGNTYTLIVAWFGATPVDVLGSDSVTLVLLAIALGVSALVCWWMARYISEPSVKLQMSARTLAVGNLDTQLDEQLCIRRDELGVLARDFNEMAARLRSQIRSKETLIRDISHELRSPLTRLRVALGLAQRQGDLKGQLERIERDLERLDALIEETLQLSRLSAEPAFVWDEVELKTLLDEIAADARMEADAAGKGLSLSVSPNMSVRGNPALLRRAIDNVVCNAIRFAPERTNVDVSARVVGNDAIIEIRDHGPGVQQQDLKRIFEAFYRVNDARDRASGGTGLGLAITERIMALHGGHALARNASNGGLIVELSLPATVRADELNTDGSENHSIATMPASEIGIPL